MQYTFNQLSKKAKDHCLKMQKKYNFKKLSEPEILVKIKDWKFNAKGEFHNPLNN